MADGRTVLLDLTPLDTPSRFRGIGRYVRDLAVGLSRLGPHERRGMRLVGLTRLDWRGQAQTTEELGSYEGELAHEPGRLDQYRIAYQRRVGLWRAARSVGADLVHLGDPNATPLGRRLSRCGWLVTCHDLIALRHPEHYFTIRDGFGLVGRRLERRRYLSADHVVAISDATAADLRRFFGLPAERVTRVYNGVDLDRWTTPSSPASRVAAELGLAPGSYLLYVGDLDWRKNAEAMIAALAKARRRGAEVHLVLAGVLSEARVRTVAALCARHDVAPWVHRVGYVPDEELVPLFRSALAHLFVSRIEGFGLPVVEAMACGCPVIASNDGAVGEVAGDAAWRVDPEDHDAIADAILALASRPELRADQIARGRVRAERFSLRAQAEEMVALYARLLGSSA